MSRYSPWLGLTVAAALAGVLEGAEPPSFNDQIAPLFRKYCTGCHNADDHEGELVLSDYERLLAGGEHGAVVTPGDSRRSRLVQVLTGQADPQMPPEDNERPTGAEVALLSAWIDAGANGPTGAAPDPTLLVTPRIAVRGKVVEPVSAAACRATDGAVMLGRYGRVEQLGGARPFAGLRGRVNAVGFSRDGALLWAAAGEPGLFGELYLWNFDSAKLLKTFRGHQDSLYAAALSPDAKLLATGSYDQQIKLWDTDSGQEVKTLAGHNDAVFDLAFRPDGKVLASASGDRTVKLWDVSGGERLDTLGQSLKDLYCLAFSPDGRRLVAGGVDNRIRLWEISAAAKENTNPLVYSRFAHEGAIIKLAFSPDGRTLVSAGDDRTVKIWDAAELSERLVLEPQSDWPAAIAIGPDNQTLVVGRLDGTVGSYELATGKTSSKLGALSQRPAAALRLLIESAARAGRVAGISSAVYGLALLAPAAAGQVADAPPAKPELISLVLKGLRQGTTEHRTFAGKNLAGASVKSSHERLAATVLTATAEQVEVEISTPADLALGRYELWVVTPGGESAHQAVWVDDLKAVAEQEPNDAPAAGNELQPPIAVWGALTAAGDNDRFHFNARAGETAVFEIAAAELGSKANAVLKLFDAQSRVLAANNDFAGSLDPALDYTFPQDGAYTIEVSDLLGSGSGEHYYRLAIGPFRFVTTIFPLGAAAHQPVDVELLGLNVPAGTRLNLPASPPGELEVALDPARYRYRKLPKLVLGMLPELIESEPNDQPDQATAIGVPGVVNGRIGRGADGRTPDVDLYRFEAQAGRTLILETDAARRGSPIDTVVEVLSTDGRTIPRLLLAATRDSAITFRGIDASTRDCRVSSWEEMQLNELLYLNGEVVKLFRAPQGPDSGFLFYEGEAGKRKNYFDTSATAHALDEPCYIVEPHALGTRLVPNGLPVFRLDYVNDDDSQRRMGSDSRLSFTAPAAGSYLVRVRDARGEASERHAYRMIVRPPRPDFNVSVTGAGPTVDAGSGKAFSLVADRLDGFDGEIRVELAGLPPGFDASSPVVIQAGHRDARGTIWAAADAPAPTPENAGLSRLQATASIDGNPVTKEVGGLGDIKLGAKPKLLVRLEPVELTIAPGSTVAAVIKVERNGHDDVITFNVDNLPHGVIVDNIGLNGVLLLKGETERQIFLNAAAWVPETDRFCFAVDQQAGNQVSRPVLLKVRRPAAAAGKTAAN